MKQNKRTTIFKLALLIVCIAVLAIALVACGEKDKNSENNSHNDEDGSLVSQDEMNTYLAYFLAYGRKESTFMLYYSLLKAGGVAGINNDCMELGISISGSNNIFTAFIFNNSTSATVAYESLKNENRLGDFENVMTHGSGSELIGNKIIIDYPQGYYRNVVLKSELPSDISKPCVDFMYDVVKNIFENNNENKYAVMIDQNSYSDEKHNNLYRFQAIFFDQDNNVIQNYIMTNDSLIVKEYREKFPKIYDEYTDDSYMDFDREKGYVFAKLIEKFDEK